MLWRSGRRILTKTRLYRLYSTSAEPYANFQKLRAYPFTFDQEKAISYLGIIAAGLCKKDFFSSAAARFFPQMFQPIQPKRIVPLYFPAWVIDAEIEATATIGDVERKFVVQFQDACLPGSNFEVISTVPLWSSETSNTPEPWSSALTHQFGQDISCLPFTVYPLTGLKALSSWTPRISSSASFSLENVKPNLAVFRPILVPVYLAQYETKDPEDPEPRTCTLFMDALSSTSTIRAYRPPTSYTNEYDEGIDNVSKAMGFLTNPDGIFSIGTNETINAANITHISLNPHRTIVQKLNPLANAKLRDPETIEEMAKASVVESDDSDPRIRAYDVEDRAEVEKWMDVGSELMIVERILESIQGHMGSSPGGGIQDQMRAPIETLKTSEKELQKQKADLEPEWWKEYSSSKKGNEE